MKRQNIFTGLALCAALLSSVAHAGQAPGPAPAAQQSAVTPGANEQARVQAAQRPQVSCQRGGLQYAVRLYLEAQAKGDVSGLPLASNVIYTENLKPAELKSGFLTKPLKIDRHMSLYDDRTCETFTEIIVTDEKEPWVAGVTLRVNHDKIAEVKVIWTTTGYWLFNADNYFNYSSQENWGPIPAEKRTSYGDLIHAANAYMDAFLDGKVDLVPWGYPCVRVEGGMTTSRGRDDDSCESGMPAGVNISSRQFIVDEVFGSVVVWCVFGGGAADTHLFRVENGKLRYVHTITHLLQSSFRGGPTGTNADIAPGGAAPR